MCCCSIYVLVNYGCRCGAFESEANKLWFNGRVYFVAQTHSQLLIRSQQELPLLISYCSDWITGDGLGWRLLPEEQPLTFSFNDSTSETLLAKNWAELYPVGFLAST